MFIACATRRRHRGSASAESRRRQNVAALRHSGCGEGQYRRRGPADHRRMSGFSLSRRAGTPPRSRDCARPARSLSARPISISSRPDWSACARPTASAAICSTQSSFRRFEHRLGARGRRRDCAAVARHRYRGFGPRTGCVQQYCRPQAEPRFGIVRRRRTGLPHARLRLGVCADGRRCDGGAEVDRRAGRG